MTLIGVVIQLIVNFKINRSNNELKKQIEKDNRDMADKWNQKKIDADIISKSRMQWINETKKLVSDFMNDSSFLLAQITLFCEKNVQVSEYWSALNNLEMFEKTTEVMDETKRLEKLINVVDQQQLDNVAALNGLQEKMSRSRLLIKLQFSDNEENNLIVEKVESITDQIRVFILSFAWSQGFNLEDKKKLVGESLTLRKSKQEEIEELVEILRDYYKKEWEKVKTGQ